MKKNEKLKFGFTPTPVFAKKKLVWGFTLIETLVAVTILSAAVAGPMVLSIKNIGIAAVSKDQLVAFYLGQEVIEYVRNVRDTNILSESSDWLDGVKKCVPAEGISAGCYIDTGKKEVNSCEASGCVNKLKFDGQNYNYNTNGKETAFIRTVKIDDTAGIGGDEAKVNISVKWTGKYGEKIVNLQDNIFNWR